MNLRGTCLRAASWASIAVGVAVAATVAPATAADAEVTAARVVPPVLDDVATLCALLSGCSGLPIASSVLSDDFGACLKRYAPTLASPAAFGVSLSVRECGMRAASCTSLRECLLRGVKPDACAGRGKTGAVGMCDADGRAIVCSKEKVAAVRDCPRGGEHCRVREGEAVCVLDRCEVADGERPKCLGSKKTACDKGLIASVDCSVLGMVCDEGPDGAACVPKGSACSSDRCVGGAAIGCFAGREVAVDCERAQMVCGEAMGPFGRCQRPASELAACSGETLRCEGATVKGCFGGATVNFQCAAVGLKKCETVGKGVRCAP